MSKCVIGLVGGIGSGKSSVSAQLQRRGGYLISADELGHEALRQPDIIQRVVQRWGQGILDARGSVDRRRLGRIVFSQSGELKALEALVFPYIEGRIRDEVQRAQRLTEARFVVLDAAIMIEAGWARACDCIVFVQVPRPERLKRLAAQRKWTEDELEAREKAQLPVAEKISRAHFVLDNSGPSEETAKQVEDLLVRLKVS